MGGGLPTTTAAGQASSCSYKGRRHIGYPRGQHAEQHGKPSAEAGSESIVHGNAHLTTQQLGPDGNSTYWTTRTGSESYSNTSRASFAKRQPSAREPASMPPTRPSQQHASSSGGGPLLTMTSALQPPHGRLGKPQGHEALKAFLHDAQWGERLRYMLNDFLYRGELPPGAGGGHVLLPKTLGAPKSGAVYP